MLGEYAREIVKLLHLLELGLAAGKIDNRPAALGLIEVADQKPVVAATLNIGGERTGRPPTELKLQIEIVNNLLREQTDQVGITRQPGIKVREDPLGRGRPADIIVLL